MPGDRLNVMKPALLAFSVLALPLLGSEPTFSKDVAPILYGHCAACHRPGDIAPMPLLSYGEARPWAKAIRNAVLTRKMPPWHADPRYGHFANDRSLSAAEIETIKAWVDSGAKAGEASDLPPRPQFPDGWRVGKPDSVFAIPSDFEVKAGSPDRYMYFTVPTKFTEDVWVQSVELKAGNRAVVHHAHVYLQLPETAAKGPKQKDFTFKDGDVHHIVPDAPVVDDGCSSADNGYWPGRKPGETQTMLGSFCPGKDPDVFPEGYARKIPAGAVLGFQIHYNSHSIQGTEKDRTSVGFIFAKQPPKQRLRRIDVSNFLFQIPAGDGNHEVTACYVFEQDVRLVSYTAHMHIRGKDMKFEATHPGGRTETLFSVPHYDFHWQTEYRLEEPVPVEKGTRLKITAHFDNSANNPANPDPAKVIRWGEPSFEEMMDGWIEFILPANAGGAEAAKML